MSILVDYNRSLRKNSNLLHKLKDEYSITETDNFDICRFNANRTLIPRLFGNPIIGEIMGVMHMKFFVFDDTVVLTGYSAMVFTTKIIC